MPTANEKHNADQTHQADGFATVEFITPLNPPVDPGGKPHNNNLGDWIRRDAEFKERGGSILKRYS